MNKNWKDPNIIIGPVAEGDNFFKRDDLVESIWDGLKKGNCVQLTAPRRVGKTSIMQYMEKMQTENYKLIFSNIEGIQSANEFYERIYTLLLKRLDVMDKARMWFEKFFKSRSITKISKDGIEWEKKPDDFLKETNALLMEINDNPEVENIVLLLDELPVMLFNISKQNKFDAISILHNLRYWRQQTEMNKKVKYVLAGSVGIHYVVTKIEGRSAVLGDLFTVIINPLSFDEALEYSRWATADATLVLEDLHIVYLLEKIQYFTPFFINLMLHEINIQAKKINYPIISEKDIDNAFDRIVKLNDYFKDWKARLYDYMSKDDFDFVNELLIHTAHNGSISIQVIYDKAVKHNKTADYMGFIFDLEKDGYLAEIDDRYRIISPFLSAFWKRNYPQFSI